MDAKSSSRSSCSWSSSSSSSDDRQGWKVRVWKQCKSRKLSEGSHRGDKKTAITKRQQSRIREAMLLYGDQSRGQTQFIHVYVAKAIERDARLAQVGATLLRKNARQSPVVKSEPLLRRVLLVESRLLNKHDHGISNFCYVICDAEWAWSNQRPGSWRCQVRITSKTRNRWQFDGEQNIDKQQFLNAHPKSSGCSISAMGIVGDLQFQCFMRFGVSKCLQVGSHVVGNWFRIKAADHVQKRMWPQIVANPPTQKQVTSPMFKTALLTALSHSQWVLFIHIHWRYGKI